MQSFPRFLQTFTILSNHPCRYLETRRGQISIGLLIFSAGGTMLLNIMEATTDPGMKQMWQMAIVFWTVFSLKTIYSFAWKQNGSSGEATEVANSAEEAGNESNTTTRRTTRRRAPRA